MTYYVLLIIDYNDGTSSTKSVYSYETENEAVSKFHSSLGGYMAKDNVSHILCLAVNSEGGIYRNEAYTATVEETDEEETSES